MTSGLTSHSSLEDWLQWQETAHTRPIDPGLKRVASVYERLRCATAHPIFTVTIAGTNGKGSSAAMLEAIFSAAGYRVGVYSTPHVLCYNERIRIDSQLIDDQQLCLAFAAIDQARGDVSLSYFEFGTLAALWLFERAQADIQILEVGLGGRLDAVNIIDADVALITTIHLDHAEWLGTDRSVIATEKAGIFRPQQFAVCADPTVPSSLTEYAHALGTDLICAGRDYKVLVGHDDNWSINPELLLGGTYPVPQLKGAHQIQNAAGVVQVINGINSRFSNQLSISKTAVDKGLQQASALGRLQSVSQAPYIWLDVAHNPQSASVLAQFFEAQPIKGQRFAVMAVMADKDVEGIVEPLLPIIDHWYITMLDMPRAETTSKVKSAISSLSPDVSVEEFEDVNTAWQSLRARLQADDGVVAFGSFYLVEASLRAL